MLDGSMKQMKDLNQTIGEKIIYTFLPLVDTKKSQKMLEESDQSMGKRRKKNKKREYFEMEKQNPPQKQ